ncbi:hypothetical protein QFZ28_005878 [Neobacillus niacini]|uniref:hypothetical protein n=1 Tax=Neobacillus niacini TaxID=86668 RepID=UPI002784308D|nr:hypothetical protein [Neobacillus niacini]MDQ1005300.1 hypothetical protein [Neobacillus niacini]
MLKDEIKNRQPQMQVFVERFSQDYPNDPLVGSSMTGWGAAELLVEEIKRNGDDLTWDNFLQSFYPFDNWEDSIHSSMKFGKGNYFGLTSKTITQAKDGEISPISNPATFDRASRE